jgi:hypothetical protein
MKEKIEANEEPGKITVIRSKEEVYNADAYTAKIEARLQEARLSHAFWAEKITELEANLLTVTNLKKDQVDETKP